MNKIKLRECRGLRRRFPFGLVIDRNENQLEEFYLIRPRILVF
jgi:hypothetical protein